ncbi:glycoside hydrolase family 113 [Metabacillus litoralis]|uniref:glycoside hydrolase family 113 n=1 Tax=Metabacillus litoralis TaxID=152268 RepID=UPI001CFCB1B9|nr:glycosyl hydrolase family 53 [Metabacillus litoralis]
MKEIFIKGMTYGWDTTRGAYRTPEAVHSLEMLKETGSEWIALSFFTYQETFSSTEITFDYNHTMTDRDIEFAVKKAKELGLKVCLKPVVNSRDGLWRARITFPEDATDYWNKWFASYENFLLHYAELAQELDCEMFCVGCEMIGTESRVEQWEQVISKVREVYTGPLIYNANHGKEEGVEWFDKVDVIGTSAYYPVAEKPGDTEENMIKNWEKVKGKLVNLHKKFNKPILFMEIGCRSAEGCATMPWDFTSTELPFNEEEQANFYRSVMKVFWDEPWFAGFFWWDWSTKLYPLEEAKTNTYFDIYGKEAESVVKEWYNKPVSSKQ